MAELSAEEDAGATWSLTKGKRIKNFDRDQKQIKQRWNFFLCKFLRANRLAEKDGQAHVANTKVNEIINGVERAWFSEFINQHPSSSEEEDSGVESESELPLR